MKNNLFILLGMILIQVLFHMGISNAQQSVVVGQVTNDGPSVTDYASASTVLKAGISENVTVSNMRIEWVAGADNHYYLIGDFSGGTVGSKGIQLSVNGTLLNATGGPGVEVSCVGKNCSQCVLVFKKWKPYCECKQIAQISESHACDMISKYIVTTW